MDHPKRSLAKSLTWRVTASITTMVIVFVFTGEVLLSLGVGAVDVVVKFIFYYIHERVWGRVMWGKVEEV